MKINSNEMLLINKNLKFKGDEAESASTVTAPIEAPESKDSMSALNAQSMNNIAFQGVNTAALKKMGLNAMAALTLFGGSVMMTSCQDDEPEVPQVEITPVAPPQVTINITNNISIVVTINMTDDELVAAILAEQQRLIELLEQMHKDQQANHEEQMAVNKAILEELIKQGISMDRIVALLEQMNMTAEDILNLIKDSSEKQDEFFTNVASDNAEFKKYILEIIKNQKIGLNLSVQNNNLLTMILVQMAQADKNDKEIIAILNKILSSVNESIATQKEIAAEQNALMSVVLGKLSQIDKHLQQGFLAVLKNMDRFSKATIRALTEMLNKLDDMSQADKEFYDSMTGKMDKLDDDLKIAVMILASKMDMMDAHMRAYASRLLEEAIKGNKTSAEILKAIANVSDQLEEMNAAQKEFYHNALGKLDELDDHVKQGTIMIMNNMNNCTDELLAAANKIIENQNNMRKENKEYFNKFMAQLKQMDKNGQRGMAMLIQQLAVNNAISLETLNKINQVLIKMEKAHQDDLKFYNQALALLAELASKADKLGDKADSIIEALGNISLDANVDLSTIEAMLKDLLAQTKANGETLTSIDSKLNLVAITLEGIKTNIENMSGDHKAIIARLDAILAKIPEGCKCDASLKVIIEKLDKIVEEIKNGNTHEGILDDLENEFQ